jgi:hypothetical protein
VTPSQTPSQNIYHDIYDFSLFPISLGDILTWGVKSALRASAVGRSKVHIHAVCDPQKAGFNPLQTSTFLVDLFVAEAMPVFYSHPFFASLSLYRSREEFLENFSRLAERDPVARAVYEENLERFKDRKNAHRTCQYFNKLCSFHDDINEYHKQHGSYPKVGCLQDCLTDWHALQAQFPAETFWVTLQFRLRKLDVGMPVITADGYSRDAPFETWYEFLAESARLYPHVRFVTLGRLQEKPLELLRLSNVVSLRTLGMTLGHEIAALLNSDLYMGSPSGFAQAAHLSDVPYDIFNCNEEGCRHYGVPLGTERLPIATARQRLHYGMEDPATLLKALDVALHESPKKIELPGLLETNRTKSTERFFISDERSDDELTTILSSRLKAAALAIERGEYGPAREGLKKLADSFPRFVPRWPYYTWLCGILEELTREPAIDAKRAVELRIEVSRFCHPNRLIRRSGRYLDNLTSAEGFRRDGWCERKSKLVFAPSEPGDFVIIQVDRLAADDPTRVLVRINQQPPVPFVLLNEAAVLEVPVIAQCIPTEVTLEADRASRVHSRETGEYSFQILGGGVSSKRMAMPTSYRGDKGDPRQKLAAGIYSNGVTSSLVRLRIDNPFPEDTDIAIDLVGTVPLQHRMGQWCRIQVNEGKPYEALIRGKYFTANIPCPGRPHYLSIVLQFWDRDSSPGEAKENRALIKSIEVVRAGVIGVGIHSGLHSSLDYFVRRLRTKLSKKSS